MTVSIPSCPCELGLATRISILVTAGKGARVPLGDAGAIEHLRRAAL